MTQTPKPDKDEKKTHGNFTKIPNMLCEGAYADLEHDEKWLYVCLKALCKGKGTRFLSLRYIAKKTGFSISTLSKKIPRLQKAGLVHCELKKRLDEDGNEYGNAQFHVTIADKWDENDAFYGVTCSPDEQDEGEDSKPVRVVNESVPHVNTSVPTVNEPVPSRERTRSCGGTNKDITEDREDRSKDTEEESVSAIAQHARTELSEQIEEHLSDPRIQAISKEMLEHAQEEGTTNEQLSTHSQSAERSAEALSFPPAAVSPFPLSNGSTTKPAAAGGRNRARAQPKPQLTLQGQQVRDWYEEIRGKVRLTDKNTLAFSNLGDEPEMTYDNLKDVLEAWDNDKWAKDHNMVPSPQELDSGYLTFEKGLQIVKRSRKLKAEEERKKELVASGGRQKTVGGYYYFGEGN